MTLSLSLCCVCARAFVYVCVCLNEEMCEVVLVVPWGSAGYTGRLDGFT